MPRGLIRNSTRYAPPSTTPPSSARGQDPALCGSSVAAPSSAAAEPAIGRVSTSGSRFTARSTPASSTAGGASSSHTASSGRSPTAAARPAHTSAVTTAGSSGPGPYGASFFAQRGQRAGPSQPRAGPVSACPRGQSARHGSPGLDRQPVQRARHQQSGGGAVRGGEDDQQRLQHGPSLRKPPARGTHRWNTHPKGGHRVVKGTRMGRWRDGTGTLHVPGDADVPGGVDVPLVVPLEIAASYRARARGLLGRDGLSGAILLSPASGVHTFRMRFAIDVAYLDRRLTVLAVTTLRPGRLGLPRPRARHVLEAEAGAMERWGLRRGVRVAIDPALLRLHRLLYAERAVHEVHEVEV